MASSKGFAAAKANSQEGPLTPSTLRALKLQRRKIRRARSLYLHLLQLPPGPQVKELDLSITIVDKSLAYSLLQPMYCEPGGGLVLQRTFVFISASSSLLLSFSFLTCTRTAGPAPTKVNNPDQL